MILQIKELTVHYGKVQALKEVAFDIQKGQIVTLLGANGAGKTTTLHAISGVVKPTSGQILFKNDRIDGLKSHQIVRLGIALTPAGRRIFPEMTVQENLKMGAYIQKDGKVVSQSMARIFEQFPMLKAKRKEKGKSLSGGQQQMLAVGRVLMSRPELMMLDEPTLGLAPIVVKEIAQIIRQINQTGVSILLVEQNAKMALKLSEKGYVLETGRITLEGKSHDLLNNAEMKKAYLGG